LLYAPDLPGLPRRAVAARLQADAILLMHDPAAILDRGPGGGRGRRTRRHGTAGRSTWPRHQRQHGQQAHEVTARQPPRAHAPVLARWSARRSASATMVSVGLAAPPVGKTELPDR